MVPGKELRPPNQTDLPSHPREGRQSDSRADSLAEKLRESWGF